MCLTLTKEEVELLLSEMKRYEVEKITVATDENWLCIDFDIYKNGGFQTTILTLQG